MTQVPECSHNSQYILMYRGIAPANMISIEYTGPSKDTYIVGRIRSCPYLSIHGAIQSLRNAVLRQDVSIHKGAGLPGAILVGVVLVVISLRSAGTGARLHSKTLLLREGEELAAHEGVLAVGVEGSIDRTTVTRRTSKAIDGRRTCVLVVCVGCGDDHFERGTSFAEIGGLFDRDRCSP